MLLKSVSVILLLQSSDLLHAFIPRSKSVGVQQYVIRRLLELQTAAYFSVSARHSRHYEAFVTVSTAWVSFMIKVETNIERIMK